MSRLNIVVFMVYATFLSTIGLMASDMYLPALPAIQSYFDTNAREVGLSLSLYMGAFAFSQLIYGPVSDQLGRKPPLILGCIIFGLGTLGCVVAEDIWTFLAFRVLQAVGAGAAYVLWQPMVFDVFEDGEVQGRFAQLMAIGSVSPAVAPLLGGYLTGGFGWHAIFWLLLGVSVGLVAWTAGVQRESLPSSARRKFSFSFVIRGYIELFTSRFFVGFSGAIACGIGAYFVFVTMLPFVLAELGYSADSIGHYYLVLVAAFIVGTRASKALLARVGDRGCLAIGGVLVIVGATALAVVATLFTVTTAWPLVLPALVLTAGNGFLLPIGMAYLMGCYSDRAGACSSAIGFLTALAAFASTFAGSMFVDAAGVYSMAGTVMAFAILVNLSLLWAWFARVPKAA